MSTHLRIAVLALLGLLACGTPDEDAASRDASTPIVEAGTPGDAQRTGPADGSSGFEAGGNAGEGGGDGVGEGGTGSDAPAPLTAPPFDWVGVIGTGQSLSVGATADVLTTTQPFHNLKLVDTGPDPKYPIEPGSGAPQWAVTPLVEPIRPGDLAGYGYYEYPVNILGETPTSGMANTLTAVWQARGGTGEYVTAHSVVGWTNECLSNIDKNNDYPPYPASINETRVFAQLARAAGKTYGVGGIILTHGECDASNGLYGEQLYEMYEDYDTDVKAITGQTSDLVLIGSQTSTQAVGEDSSAVELWQLGMQHPGQIVCSGPKYQYQYNPGLIHLPAPGYERLGQKYAEVFDLVVNQRVAWAPLQPTGASIAGTALTVTFHVPTPPLTWADQLPLPHQGSNNTAWANGKGFEVVDGTGAAVTIADATIQGASVILTLAEEPAAGAVLTVRYAITQDGLGAEGGTGAGLIGQLRDSDDFVGWDAETLTVDVTEGSNVITDVTAGDFARRAGWDDVAGSALAAGTVVLANDDDDTLSLSNPWTGATGTASLSFHHDERNYAVHFSMPVVPAGTVTLWPLFDNVGGSDDGVAAADFDGTGFSYSTAALAAGGATPGEPVVVGPITYRWPNEPSGLLNNVVAHGQSVAFPNVAGKTTLGILGSASGTDASGAQGAFAVHYADGTTQTIPVVLTDWARGGGSYPLVGGNTVAVATAYRNNGASMDGTSAYVYAVTAPLTSSQAIASVSLPASVTDGEMHVFDMELE